MDTRTPLVVAAHCLLLVGGAHAATRMASAQAPAPPVEFAALDADQDGFVTRLEARADPTLQAAFDGVDTDRDLKLSRDEHAAWARARRAGARPAPR
jgi:hypothetical protein